MAEFSQSSKGGKSNKRPKNPDLYALLKVSRDASPTVLRKAYYALARVVHPDKCPDDPNAAENFRTLQSAYGVLSDPSRRARYDRTGRVPAELGGDDADAADDLFWQAYERCVTQKPFKITSPTSNHVATPTSEFAPYRARAARFGQPQPRVACLRVPAPRSRAPSHPPPKIHALVARPRVSHLVRAVACAAGDGRGRWCAVAVVARSTIEVPRRPDLARRHRGVRDGVPRIGRREGRSRQVRRPMLCFPPAQCEHSVTQWAVGVNTRDRQVRREARRRHHARARRPDRRAR